MLCVLCEVNMDFWTDTCTAWIMIKGPREGFKKTKPVGIVLAALHIITRTEYIVS